MLAYALDIHRAGLTQYSSLANALSPPSVSAGKPLVRGSGYVIPQTPLHANRLANVSDDMPVTTDNLGHIVFPVDEGEGILLADAISGDHNYARFQWWGDELFSSFADDGVTSMQLVIMWPGYEHLKLAYPVPTQGMTNGDLAHHIAWAYHAFFMVTAPERRSAHGAQDRFALTETNRQQRYNIDNLVVTGFTHVAYNIIQADIALR